MTICPGKGPAAVDRYEETPQGLSMYPGTFAVTTPDKPARNRGQTGEVVCHQALHNRPVRLVAPGPGGLLHWAPFLGLAEAAQAMRVVVSGGGGLLGQVVRDASMKRSNGLEVSASLLVKKSVEVEGI